MSVMTVAEFTANCPEVLENVEATGEPVFITRDGVPIVTLYSVKRKPEGIIGAMKGLINTENADLLLEPVLKPEDLIDPVRESQT